MAADKSCSRSRCVFCEAARAAGCAGLLQMLSVLPCSLPARRVRVAWRRWRASSNERLPPITGHENRLGRWAALPGSDPGLDVFTEHSVVEKMEGQAPGPCPHAGPLGQLMLGEMPGYLTACPVAAAPGLTHLRTPSETSQRSRRAADLLEPPSFQM